jgi:hypothetical protein
MLAMSDQEEFGCKSCWPDDADAAWKARGGLSDAGRVVDESHFGVRILACPRCRQRFVSIFTETIDWTGGDDPQYWTLLPLTEEEAAELAAAEEEGIERKLNSLGPGRRCLERDYPKGSSPRNHWGSGILVGPHD